MTGVQTCALPISPGAGNKPFQNLPVADARGLTVRIFPGINVFLISSVQYGEKDDSQPAACIYARPFTGDAQAHCSPAGSQGKQGLFQFRVIEAQAAVPVHEIVHEQDKEGNVHVYGGDPGLGKVHKIKGKQYAGQGGQGRAAGQPPGEQVHQRHHGDAK